MPSFLLPHIGGNAGLYNPAIPTLKRRKLEDDEFNPNTQEREAGG